MANPGSTSAPASIESVATKNKKKWTVMVFMGAGHVEGKAQPLDKQAADDLAEMERVFADGGSEGLNVFAQIHGLGTPTRRWINRNLIEDVPPGQGRDASNGTALTEFMRWALREAGHAPDDHSLLVLWGHAYHFALGQDETPTGVEALDFGELAQVLRDFQGELKNLWEAYNITGSPKLDIVAFDACDIATIEISRHLANYADYLIASQIGIPLPGWPYETILKRLINPKGTPMTPADFGAFAVRKFCEEYDEQDENGDLRAVSLTLLDLARAQEAFEAAETLAGALAYAAGSSDRELAVIQEQFFRSQTFREKPFIDVADFCLNLSRNSLDLGVQMAAAKLGDILIRPSSNGNGNHTRGSFIVEHGRNSHRTAKLQGVSLYAPRVAADTQDWRVARFFYDKFTASGETYWGRLIHVLAEGV